jgi:thiol-disulfide isomerase/thioredoxin
LPKTCANAALLFLALLAGCVTQLQNEDETGSEQQDTPEVVENSPITWTDCGGDVGDKACDFTFIDQADNDWSLYNNYGTVMVLDFSTMWCGVCQNIAPDAQPHQDHYTSMGHDFLWVTILVDDLTWGSPPDLQDIQDWADINGMTTSPVLAGDRSIIDTTAENGYPILSWPTIVVVDETLTIYNGLRGWNESVILGWVDEVLEISED